MTLIKIGIDMSSTKGLMFSITLLRNSNQLTHAYRMASWEAKNATSDGCSTVVVYVDGMDG